MGNSGRRKDIQNSGDSLMAVDVHPSNVAVKMSSGPVKDEGWSWVVLVAAFLLQAITIGVCLSSGLFIVEFMETFNTNQAATLWIASMQIGVAYLIGAPVSGLVCRKFGHRVSIIAGGLLFSIGMLASAFANGIVELYLTCGLLSGFAMGLIYSPSIGAVTSYFDRRLAMALGITMAGAGCGSMAFSQIFYLLINAYGWRGALMVTSALVLNCCVLGAVMFPNKSDSCDAVVKSALPSKSMPRLQKFFCEDLVLLKDLHFVLYFINSFFLCYGSTAVFILLVDYAVDCGFSEKSAALLLSLTGLLSMFGRFVMAGLMQCLRSIQAVNLYNISTVLCGVAVLLLPTAQDYAYFAVLCSLFGFCYGGCCSASPVVASQFFGAAQLTTIYAYMLMASGLGSLLGSPITGWMYEVTRNYHLSIALSGAGIVLSFIVLVPLYVVSCRRKLRREQISSLIVEDLKSTI